MKISTKDFRVDIVPDDYPERGELHPPAAPDAEFVGVCASVELFLAMPLYTNYPRNFARTTITHVVKSPGVWGIELDKGIFYDKHVFEIGEEEKETLADMLRAMGIEVEDSA